MTNTLINSPTLNRFPGTQGVGFCLFEVDMEKLTQEVVRDLLDYNPTSGALTWKERPRKYFKKDWAHKAWNSRHKGATAGVDSMTCGITYRRMTIFNTGYSAHRIIWLHTTGAFPKDGIDHINGIGTDNRLENLREADRYENAKNKRLPTKNTSGYNGVFWCRIRRRWTVSIGTGGQNIRMGRFFCFKKAVEVRNAAEIEYGYHPNHGRKS